MAPPPVPPHPVFRGAESGLSRKQLRTGVGQGLWRRLFRDVYVWAGLDSDLATACRGLALLLPAGAVVAHRAAARLHGVELLHDETRPPTVLVPAPCRSVPDHAGVVVRQAPLPPEDVVIVHGLQVTSPARTALDLARLDDVTEAVVVADGFLHAGLVTLDALLAGLERMRGWRGVAQAREVVRHAEPLAESPMESRLRMLLVLGGLPRPQAQVSVHDGDRFVARVDLGYREARLLIEYDGREAHAGTAFDRERARQNALVTGLGYRLLRYTGPAVLQRSPGVVQEVGRALAITATPADHDLAAPTRRRVRASSS